MSGGGLTGRQLEVLKAIWAHIDARGTYPTYREVMLDLGISSPNGLKAHLQALAKKGYMGLVRSGARGIRLAGLRLDPVFEQTAEGIRLMRLLHQQGEGAP